MNTTATELKPAEQKRQLTPMDSFRRDAALMQKEFETALPEHIPLARFMRVVTTAVQTSMASNFTNLLECDRRSLWQACMKAAQDGLLPDGREGAVIKYGDQAQWQPMVAGMRKKARNSGEISVWDVHCVYENDEFMIKLGDAPGIDHTFKLGKSRGALIGAYSVAILKDGTKSYEAMSIDEIHSIRDRSTAWKAFIAKKIKSTPWSTDEAEMARKTVAKRHAKQLPSSADLDDLMRRDDDLYDFGKDKDNVTALPKRPNGKNALDQFADGMASEKTIEHTAEEVGPAEAMQRGRDDHAAGKPKEAPPEFIGALAEAYVAGWDDANDISKPTASGAKTEANTTKGTSED